MILGESRPVHPWLSTLDYACMLSELGQRKLELDQRLRQAWDLCASPYFRFEPFDVLTAPLKLNARGLECLPDTWLRFARNAGGDALLGRLRGDEGTKTARPVSPRPGDRFNRTVLERMATIAGGQRTVTCRHFCQAVSEAGLVGGSIVREDIGNLFFVLGFIYAEGVPGIGNNLVDAADVLRQMPKTRRTLELLGNTPPEADDFQYMLAMEGDRVVFRSVSFLQDNLVVCGAGNPAPARALLTHFKKRFGAFTPDEIAELEEIIRNPKAKERDFQAFFEAHPHFFRMWDYREVHPQVYLVRQNEGALVPDFILTNPETQQATVVELKLPRPKLIVHEDNRLRFAAAVMEARAQLLEYRDWFRDKANRQRLVGKLGMDVFEPRLAVIIGRSSDFRCAIERQKLAARTPDVEVITLDDLACFARSRQIQINA